MSFSQATLVGQPVLAAVGSHLRVSWQTTAPAGTLWQVYLNRKLAWRGKSRSVLFPLPRDRVEVEVGSVAPGEGATDFSAMLPAGAPDKALLQWDGDPAMSAFRVYGSSVAGGPVVYTKPLGIVAATVAGVDLTGWGNGGWGSGYWGHSFASYSWTSGRLSTGVWSFDVVPVDQAGNEAARATTPITVTITAAPSPPAFLPGGTRLSYTFNATTRVPTLTWGASPG